jgi:hypothetical protein
MANKQGTTPSQQGSNLVFGKYKSLDEAEQGYRELVNEASKRAQQVAQTEAQLNASQSMIKEYEKLLEKATAGAQPRASVPEPSITDSDGDITPESLKNYLEARLRPIQETVQNMPQSVESATKSAMEQLLAPAQLANNEGQKFFSNPGVREEGFNRTALDSFLNDNPEINNTFQMLVSNPSTAANAYDYAHRVWKAEHKGGAVDEAEKEAAGALPETPGAPMTLPGDREDKETLMALAQQAANSHHTKDKTAFARNLWRGTKLEKQVDQLKAYGESMGIDMGNDD